MSGAGNGTSIMTDQLSLSLRAWPSKRPETESLPFLISRINEQRNGFRNVTEASLEEEIRAIEAGESSPQEEQLDTEEDAFSDPKSQREKVLAAREDIIKQIVQAQMESAYALDFVSLLLSKHAPRQAEISISPFLKQNVPMGSLGTEVVQLPQVSDAQVQDDKLVCSGWKLQSLNATADSLLKSAARLEQEMDRETKYWEQVLAVKEKGWSVCRLPREKHTLGVRYGFAEAAPEYRDRGMAALRRGENGEIELDLRNRSSEPCLLRVQVEENKNIIAFSTSIYDDSTREDSIEGSILRARNSVFDEELFHELYREARSLTNRGVRCIGNAILLPIREDKQVVIDLVPRSKSLPEAGQTKETNHDLAATIALSLRILLSHSHRQNLNRRSQLPPPLTERRPPRPIYAILRPVLAHLQHQSAQTALRDYLHEMKATLQMANLILAIECPTNSFNIPTLFNLPETNTAALVSTLLTSLSAPLQTSIQLNLPSRTASLAIHTRTHLLGTEYKCNMISSAPSSTLSTIPQETHFTSSRELEDHILHLVMLDLVSLIEALSRDDKMGKGGRWKATSPHTGEMMCVGRGERDKEGGDGGDTVDARRMMVLDVRKDKLEVRWSGAQQGEEGGNYVWQMREDNEKRPPRRLVDVLKSIR